MALNPPQVGLLSVVSTTVVMQHQLVGAEVTLHKDGASFDLGLASSPWEVFALPPGMKLRKDDLVLATQSLAGETSRPGIPAIVEGLGQTASSPRPHPDSHIYACAGNVALDGMTPGTRAEILIGGQVVGSAIAPEGAAMVELSQGVPATGAVQARARTGNLAPVTVTLPPADPPPLDSTERLPAPRFGLAPMECMTHLRIEGVVPGATVVLTRDDGSQQRQPFPTPTWLMPLATPVKAGERLTLRQDLPLCEIQGHETTADAAPVTLAAPRLTSPWCSGRVNVMHLVPGATVVFHAEDGTELGRSGASGTTCQFTLIQPTAFRFFARQELCGVQSDPSNLVSSGNDPDLVDLTKPSPVIAQPLHACQTAVKVSGQVKGGLVEVWSHTRGMIGRRHSIGSESTVAVSALLDQETIEARAVSCAQQEGFSPAATAVRATLRTPSIDALGAGTASVSVRDVAIGATLELYVDDHVANTLIVHHDPIVVAVPPLAAGQRVRARQYLCGRVASCEDVLVVDHPTTQDPQHGFSMILIHNCHTAHRTVSVWNLDHTAGSATRVDSLEANVDDWGTCPAFAAPLEVELEDGHVHEIVVVDPDAVGCEGQDDPMVVACQRNSGVFLGDRNGPSETFYAN